MLDAHVRAPPRHKLVSLYLFDAVARHVQELKRRGDSPQAAQALSLIHI